MPLYEYLCRECDQQVELLVRSQDEELACPLCDSTKLMKLLSVPASPNIEGSSGANSGDSASSTSGGCCGGGGCDCG